MPRFLTVLALLAAAATADEPALHGLDPVSYFPEGGAVARAGDASHTAVHGGMTYRFATKAHRDAFAKAPARFLPEYAGWCARALAGGREVPADPRVFRVHGDELYLFADARARSSWLGDEPALRARADAAWTKRGRKPGPRAPYAPPPVRHENLADGLALQGYDPVAYFPEGGGKARAGDTAHALSWHGATYRFASAAHKAQFQSHPERYVPAYGGWCAYAVGKFGKKVAIDPEAFLVHDGRLLVFFRNKKVDTRDRWSDDESALDAEARRRWAALTDEK